MDENSTKVRNHYQLSLPLKNESIIFPDNRHLAEKRLRYLKERFLRNSKFFADYRKFIKVLLVKGYARKSPKETTEDRTWYVSHNGVYHPNKPKKIKVVFDCSDELNGISLNKSLMSGPDLTNQIVGVITGFREESVVIMSDIEVLLHQVLVPEKDRSLLRFLWREDHNINNSISDFEMGVFRGTSSPSCCYYALKRTTPDNEEKYQKEVTDTLKRNLYR